MMYLQKSLENLKNADIRMVLVNTWRLIIGLPTVFFVILFSLPAFPWVDYQTLIPGVGKFVKKYGSMLMVIGMLIIAISGVFPTHPIRVAIVLAVAIAMFLLDKQHQLFG